MSSDNVSAMMRNEVSGMNHKKGEHKEGARHCCQLPRSSYLALYYKAWRYPPPHMERAADTGSNRDPPVSGLPTVLIVVEVYACRATAVSVMARPIGG